MLEAPPGQPIEATEIRPAHATRDDVIPGRIGQGDERGAGTGHGASPPEVLGEA